MDNIFSLLPIDVLIGVAGWVLNRPDMNSQNRIADIRLNQIEFESDNTQRFCLKFQLEKDNPAGIYGFEVK